MIGELRVATKTVTLTLIVLPIQLIRFIDRPLRRAPMNCSDEVVLSRRDSFAGYSASRARFSRRRAISSNSIGISAYFFTRWRTRAKSAGAWMPYGAF
jgi:hypothetical protein